jgi:hypothetical protein
MDERARSLLSTTGLRGWVASRNHNKWKVEKPGTTRAAFVCQKRLLFFGKEPNLFECLWLQSTADKTKTARAWPSTAT